MLANTLLNVILVCFLNGLATGLLVYALWVPGKRFLGKEKQRLDIALNKELLLGINPNIALACIGTAIIIFGIGAYLLSGNAVAGALAAAGVFLLPKLVVHHLTMKRRDKLDDQLIDALTTMSSSVRAGLNLVQSIQLLVTNSSGPVKQEFTELIKEYDLGVDLTRAMFNTAERIGSPHYRLVFTALQAHRERGGNMAESLDRISDSVREFQRLEGKLKTLTAQGRSQARMLGIMPFVILIILYFILPAEVSMLFTEPVGRLILLGAVILVGVGFLWIRNIMSIDI